MTESTKKRSRNDDETKIGETKRTDGKNVRKDSDTADMETETQSSTTTNEGISTHSHPPPLPHTNTTRKTRRNLKKKKNQGYVEEEEKEENDDDTDYGSKHLSSHQKRSKNENEGDRGNLRELESDRLDAGDITDPLMTTTVQRIESQTYSAPSRQIIKTIHDMVKYIDDGNEWNNNKNNNKEENDQNIIEIALFYHICELLNKMQLFTGGDWNNVLGSKLTFFKRLKASEETEVMRKAREQVIQIATDYFKDPSLPFVDNRADKTIVSVRPTFLLQKIAQHYFGITESHLPVSTSNQVFFHLFGLAKISNDYQRGISDTDAQKRLRTCINEDTSSIKGAFDDETKLENMRQMHASFQELIMTKFPYSLQPAALADLLILLKGKPKDELRPLDEDTSKSNSSDHDGVHQSNIYRTPPRSLASASSSMTGSVTESKASELNDKYDNEKYVEYYRKLSQRFAILSAVSGSGKTRTLLELLSIKYGLFLDLDPRADEMHTAPDWSLFSKLCADANRGNLSYHTIEDYEVQAMQEYTTFLRSFICYLLARLTLLQSLLNSPFSASFTPFQWLMFQMHADRIVVNPSTFTVFREMKQNHSEEFTAGVLNVFSVLQYLYFHDGSLTIDELHDMIETACSDIAKRNDGDAVLVCFDEIATLSNPQKGLTINVVTPTKLRAYKEELKTEGSTENIRPPTASPILRTMLKNACRYKGLFCILSGTNIHANLAAQNIFRSSGMAPFKVNQEKIEDGVVQALVSSIQYPCIVSLFHNDQINRLLQLFFPQNLTGKMMKALIEERRIEINQTNHGVSNGKEEQKSAYIEVDDAAVSIIDRMKGRPRFFNRWLTLLIERVSNENEIEMAVYHAYKALEIEQVKGVVPISEKTRTLSHIIQNQTTITPNYESIKSGYDLLLMQAATGFCGFLAFSKACQLIDHQLLPFVEQSTFEFLLRFFRNSENHHDKDRTSVVADLDNRCSLIIRCEHLLLKSLMSTKCNPLSPVLQKFESVLRQPSPRGFVFEELIAQAISNLRVFPFALKHSNYRMKLELELPHFPLISSIQNSETKNLATWFSELFNDRDEWDPKSIYMPSTYAGPDILVPISIKAVPTDESSSSSTSTAAKGKRRRLSRSNNEGREGHNGHSEQVGCALLRLQLKFYSEPLNQSEYNAAAASLDWSRMNRCFQKDFERSTLPQRVQVNWDRVKKQSVNVLILIPGPNKDVKKKSVDPESQQFWIDIDETNIRELFPNETHCERFYEYLKLVNANLSSHGKG